MTENQETGEEVGKGARENKEMGEEKGLSEM